MPYRITIPGKMYRALRGRNALENQNPKDQAAFAVFKEARRRQTGTGSQFIVTGPLEVVDHILDYLHSLVGLVEGGIVPAYEFGTTLQGLLKVVGQKPKHID